MEFKEGKQKLYLEDENEEMIAEICYSMTADGDYRITRTFADRSLKGQGVGDKLLDAVAEKARKEGKKIVPQCSFVVKRFEESDKYDDLKVK